jgi:hypothetical protein
LQGGKLILEAPALRHSGPEIFAGKQDSAASAVQRHGDTEKFSLHE